MNSITAFVVGVTLILQIGQSDGQWNPFSFLLPQQEQQDYQEQEHPREGPERRTRERDESPPARLLAKFPQFFGQVGRRAGADAGAGNSPFGIPMNLGALGGLNSLGLQSKPNDLFGPLSMGLFDGNSLLNGGGLLGRMLGRSKTPSFSEMGEASAGGGALIGAPLQSMPVIGSASSGSGMTGNISPVDAEIARLYNSGGGRSVTVTGSGSAPSSVGGSDKLDPLTIAKLLTAFNGSGDARSAMGPESSGGGNSIVEEHPSNNNTNNSY